MEQKNPATPLSPQLKESKARGGCCENIFKNIRNGPPLNPSPPEEEVSSSMIDLCWRNCPFRRAAIFVYPPSDSWPSAQMFQWLLDEFAVFNSLKRLLFWFVIDQLTDRRVKFLKMIIFNRAHKFAFHLKLLPADSSSANWCVIYGITVWLLDIF